jgi:hypothetical protein
MRSSGTTLQTQSDCRNVMRDSDATWALREDSANAAAATPGDSSKPKNGQRTPAASGLHPARTVHLA